MEAKTKRRIASLVTLLGIYLVGLGIVALIGDGPDIGLVLAAIFGHVAYVTAKGLIRQLTDLLSGLKLIS